MHVCVLTLYIILVFLFIMRVLRKPSSRPLNLKFFRKPTSPPLNLKSSSKTYLSFLTVKEGPPLISVFFNSLYDPFGSPCRGQTRCSNRFAIRLADHQRSTPAANCSFLCGDEPALLKSL